MNSEKTKKRFEEIEKRLDLLEGKSSHLSNNAQKDIFNFIDKKKEHSLLLEELLKSDFCHINYGLTIEEILSIFKNNGRPVVRKKISDLLHIWKKRKRIESIKTKGEKKHKYFWIENEIN